MVFADAILDKDAIKNAVTKEERIERMAFIMLCLYLQLDKKYINNIIIINEPWDRMMRGFIGVIVNNMG